MWATSLSSTLRTAGLIAILWSPIAGAENGLSIFGGLRASGEFEDAVSGQDVRIRDTGTAAIALDLSYDESRQIQIFASYQNTSMNATLVGGTDATSQRVPLRVTYLHVGGTNFFDGPVGRGPYVMGGLGATLLSPGLDGLESEIRPSMNIGIGYLLPVAGAVAIRFEGRAYFTLINSSSSLFCSGGCVIAIKGDTLQQFEMLAGLTWRF